MTSVSADTLPTRGEQGRPRRNEAHDLFFEKDPSHSFPISLSMDVIPSSIVDSRF